MSEYIIVGDIHNKSEKVEKILKDVDQPVIFLGDYFDDFYDNAEDITKTAHWLKESLTKPNRIHLMGNHDFHYRIQPRGLVYCSGFDYYKHDIINSILSSEDWEKINFFHAIDDFWFSHAGVTKYWFTHPLLGLTKEGIEKTIDEAVVGMKMRDVGKMQPLWAADFIRGGRYKKGGLLWNDWQNSDYHDNSVQIMGHTPHGKILVKRSLSSVNINVDCGLNQILQLDTEKKWWSMKNV